MLYGLVVRQVGALGGGQFDFLNLVLVFRFVFFRVFLIQFRFFNFFPGTRFGDGFFLVSFMVKLFRKIFFVYFFLVGEIRATGQGVSARTSLRFFVLGLDQAG